jgi:hypothetical protein
MVCIHPSLRLDKVSTHPCFSVNLPSSKDNQTDMVLSSRPLRVRIIRAAPLFIGAVIMVLQWLDIQRTVPRQYPNNADSPAPVSPIPQAAVLYLAMVLGFSVLLELDFRYLRGLRTRLEAERLYWRYWLLYSLRYINWYMNTLLITTYMYFSGNVRDCSDSNSSTHVPL